MSSIDISIRRRVLVRAGASALALGMITWTSVAGAASGGSGIADLVEQVSPSVVTVYSTHTPESVASPGPMHGNPDGSPFEEFFKRVAKLRRLEPEVEYVDSFLLRGPRQLRLTAEPA